MSKSYLVRVAMRTGLTVDQMAEARRLKKSQLVDEDTRRGSGIDDERDWWTFVIEAADGDEAMLRAAQAMADAFTGVDPQAELIGLAWIGD